MVKQVPVEGFQFSHYVLLLVSSMVPWDFLNVTLELKISQKERQRRMPLTFTLLLVPHNLYETYLCMKQKDGYSLIYVVYETNIYTKD